ncbi:MAG: PSD1 domain-containing protein [Verrucomicrobiales bacterium]|nr:PSD1 domain-containing protein [Verrucomicrobiales bacterium]
MTKVSIQFLGPVLVSCWLWVGRAWGVESEGEFFEKRIRPVLAEHCFECHSAESQKNKGGLRVDSRSGLLSGGETGPALVPGKPLESLLWSAMAHRHPELTMPPKKPKLPSSVLSDFEKWIRDGAHWPGGDAVAAVPIPGGFDLEQRKAKLDWIWKPPVLGSVPAVRDTNWARGVIDQFLLSRLEKEGIRPAPPAEPAVWLRRVHFALTGLPPSMADLQAFVQDPSDAARERVVDRLLGSPRFGERWARHWLDLMRYAESRGHEGDYIIPNAYEYRDYVIRALNSDVPYDEFVREHLAGDLLAHPRRHPQLGFNESVLATGWAFLGEEIHAPVDTRLDETERVDNRVDVLSKSFLGLTVSCARCHDHKFDAISQRDYYALAGFFISSGQRLARFESMESEQTAARQLAGLRSRSASTLAKHWSEAQLATLPQLKSYLITAAEVARKRTNAPPSAGKPLKASDLKGPESASLRELSAARSLDGEVLAHWTAALLSSVSNRADLLSPFASVALLGNLPPRGKANPGWEAVGAAPDARVVLDFRNLAPGQWRVDGVAFGAGPVSGGEFRLAKGFSNAPPAFRIQSRTAAWADQDWFPMGFRPGVEQEPAMYGGWVRDGAMLRSPKFQLTGGKLHYLVKGGGRVLAVVDSQRLVTGPIHTALVREWQHRDQWHWVSQNLAEYSGHRVALEFSPETGFDTAIALVVESETPPEEPWSASAHLTELMRYRSASNVISIEAAAQVYQERLTSAIRSFAAGGAKDSPEDLELADWLARRPELVSGPTGEWPAPFANTLRNYLAERDALLQPVIWKSRVAPAMWDGDGTDEFLLVRGKHHAPKGTVPRRFLEAVSGVQPIPAPQSSGRLELAEIIADPANPLTARVFVNRVWHHLFGRGIVPSVDNFGWLGQRPSHPELLDYLAASFTQQDQWSMKLLIRRIVLSSAFAMSSKPTAPEVEARDPENVLLHRMNLRRLEAEAIRDAILAVSGRLDTKMYGVSVPLHESQFVEARGLRSERGPLDGAGRRSVYVAARRNFLPMMMTAFDMPIPFTTVGRRNISNVPGQMLFLMNDPFVHQQAGVWAKRSEREHDRVSEDERIQDLFLSAFSRPASDKEVAACRQALREARQFGDEAASASESSSAAWTELCHALLGAKEFIFIP